MPHKTPAAAMPHPCKDPVLRSPIEDPSLLQLKELVSSALDKTWTSDRLWRVTLTPYILEG